MILVFKEQSNINLTSDRRAKISCNTFFIKVFVSRFKVQVHLFPSTLSSLLLSSVSPLLHLCVGYTLLFVSPLSSCAPPFCPINSDVSRHAHCQLCPNPSMAKQDRWLLGRLPGRISGPVCVRLCVSVQYLKATLHRRTMASPAHTGVGLWHQAATQ